MIIKLKTDVGTVNLLSTTAADLQALLSRQAVTSVDIALAYLDQIEKHNHNGLHLNAVIATTPRARVLEVAQRLDLERLNGATRGPFHGIPILVKLDNMCQDAYSTPSVGVETTCGSYALAGTKTKSDARVIDLLISHGMIVIGKANMSEWGNMKGSNIMAGWSPVGGQTQTPYVKGGVIEDRPWLTHSGPSGSSSGSAAGVAAGFAPLSLGTESDGSIIMPAARAALYALKITVGQVDNTGVQPAVKAFDCLGGFARCVPDLARLTAALQGLDLDEYISGLSPSWEGVRLGFVDPTRWRTPPELLEPVDGFLEQTDAALHHAEDSIERLGGRVVRSIPLASWQEITGAMPDMKEMEDLNPYGIKETINDWLARFEGAPKTIDELIDFNLTHADKEFTKRNNNQATLEAVRDCTTTTTEFDRNLKALRDKAAGSVIELLEKYEVDAILGPGDSRVGSVGAAAGFPVASLPLGFANFNGRGFALHMLAPAKHENLLLRIMSAWQATFHENVRPPQQLLE